MSGFTSTREPERSVRGDEHPRNLFFQAQVGARGPVPAQGIRPFLPPIPVSRAILPDSRDREIRQAWETLRRRLADAHSELHQSFRHRAITPS